MTALSRVTHIFHSTRVKIGIEFYNGGIPAEKKRKQTMCAMETRFEHEEIRSFC